MKYTFKKLQAVNNRIRECESEAEAVKRLPFYSIFNQEGRRKKDLTLIRIRMEELLLQKFVLLEQLKEEIAEEQSLIISRQPQPLTLNT